MILANQDHWFQFLPPLAVGLALSVVAGIVAAAMLLRWILGPPNAVARRWGLWVVRGAVLTIVTLVLLNPVRVDQQPGPFQRPEMFYLFDTSASMQMGNPRTRWDESLSLVKRANQLASSSPALVKPFRFGHRLSAIEDPAQVGLPANVADASRLPGSVLAVNHVANTLPLLPTDGDTRLLTALRQVSSRFGRVPPQALVLFSDGRAHDEAGLEQLAAEFARLKVPIHVVPVGDTSKGGDVAVSAVVAPPKARKYTEVEVQVFLRSFGYDGKRTEVQLQEIVDNDRVGRTLAALPITLQSGFQSVSLSFRTDLTTRKLRVNVPPLADEVSDRNNQVNAEMGIDRTKIRVLYVEGSSQPYTSVRAGEQTQMQGPFSDLKAALIEDEDIECVVLAAPGGVGRLLRMADYGQVDGVRGFPTTVAELSAFDALILSNIPAEAFTEKQLEWIDQWIGQRGGGLCMIGGENSFASGGWANTPLAEMLPIEMLAGGFDWMPGEQVKVAAQMPATPHPLWNLLSDEKQNRQIVAGFPQLLGLNRFASTRTNLATVLATTSVSGSPATPMPQEALNLRSLSRLLAGGKASEPQKNVAVKKNNAADAASLPAIVAGRYGRGRTMAMAFPFTAPYAEEFCQKWGQGDNRYYAKFARNLVYWLTESSAIGRRRLVASADKRFYRPGEQITISAATYDESASPTRNYRVVAMIEPHTAPGEAEPDTSPLKWPAGLTRESGEEGIYIAWGEEFELALGGQDKPLHAVQLPLAEMLASGASSQSLRVELTAYEDYTQVDSTSLDIQVLHDPFEQQNPFPNHDLLRRLATSSGGKVLRTPDELAEILNAVDADVGPTVLKRSPVWSNVWVLLLILGLLTGEWCWRRTLGLA
jgi:uncharacterized membrane protein